MTQTATRKSTRKQQQRSIRTQEKLLDAAASAFAENGFKGTSTRDIAERAGVHHPLITYHFKSKDELWRAAVSRVFDRFRGTLAEKQEEFADAGPRARTAALIREHVHFAAANPELHNVMFQEASRPNPRIDWLIENYLKPMYERSVKDLVALQEDGIAPQGDPAMLYNLVRLSTAALLALRMEVKSTTGLDLEDERNLDALAEMLIRIYLPNDDAAAPTNAEHRHAS